MSDEEARATFRRLRWADNAGEPYCPKCGCLKVYAFATRPVWKCNGCAYQFSVTAGTIFADRKRPVRDYLLAIAIFANGAKGHSALQLSRDLACTYRSAFVLAHKLREALAAEQQGVTLTGTSDVDGAYFGGHAKPENKKEDRADRRLAEEQTGKRKVVVVLRERNGRTLPFVCGKESDALPIIRQRIPTGTRSTPMRRAPGTLCTLTTTCGGSIIPSSSGPRRGPAPTRPKAISRVSAAPRSAPITGSPGISPNTPPRWRGAKTTAASATANRCPRSSASRSPTR
jgi:ribosomal protein L37AE/L43A